MKCFDDSTSHYCFGLQVDRRSFKRNSCVQFSERCKSAEVYSNRRQSTRYFLTLQIIHFTSQHLTIHTFSQDSV